MSFVTCQERSWSMQSLFAHQPVLLGVLLGSLLIWRVMEASVDIKSFKHLRAGARRQDKGSHAVLICMVTLGIFLSTLLAFQVPATAITSVRIFLFWLGMLLVYAGITLRLYAIHVLGTSFTTTVAIAPDQHVIEAGPYRLIRHPSYTGLLITLLGIGLSSTNWLSLLALMGCALIGLSSPIHVEERVLQEHVGLRYQEYMQRSKRLIPFVL